MATDASVDLLKNETKNIQLTASDNDGDTLTYTLSTAPQHGVVTITANMASYAPTTDYVGSDSFSFVSNDGQIDSNTATISIIVALPPNNAPMATDLSVDLLKNETKNIQLTASDIDGDTLTYALSTAPQHGVVTITASMASYTPTTDYIGSDSFTFVSNDGQVDSNMATVTLTISVPPNNAPVATDSSATLIKNEVKNITLTTTDADGDTLIYSVTTVPTNGVITLNNNIVQYTPTTNYVGSDSFTFVGNDGQVDSNIATVTIEVAATSTVSASILDVNGAVISDVTVKVIDNNGNMLNALQSDLQGQFTVVQKVATSLVFSLSKNGFANQVIPATTPDLANFNLPITITMMPRNTAQTLDINAGGTLNSNNGAKVIVTANSFVDAQGNQVSGNIDVNITPVDVSNSLLLNAFPGQFTGISESTGQPTTIATLGTVEFIFSQNGEPLQLADGATAQIEMPLFVTIHPATNQPIAVGDEIELWSLNENTGIWLQEGMGTVIVNTESTTGLSLLATVTHFTWWNIDVPIDTFDLEVILNGTVNGGLATIYVDLGTPSPLWYQNANTPTIVGSNRHYVVPVSGQACVWIQYFDINNTAALSPQQCINNPTAGGDYPLTFMVPTTGVLNLFSRNNASYITGIPMAIDIFPQSLESTVSYIITSGTLPSGMSLTGSSATNTRLVGTPTVIANHSIVIEGTDSDGFSDSVTLTFSLDNPPPPSLRSLRTLYSPVNLAVNKDFSSAVIQAIDPVTSWTVTNIDNSPVGADVTISNTGVFNLANFDGVSVSYRVLAYNMRGASNAGTVNIQLLSPPVLSSTIMLYADLTTDPNQIISEFLEGYNSGALASSWVITKSDGSAVASSVTIANTSELSLSASEAMQTYHVTAINNAGTSNIMVITFSDTLGGGPCTGGLCP
jgi:hypothetical protein